MMFTMLVLRSSICGIFVGGNGGRGGDVILECSPTVWDFRGLQNHIVCNPFIFSVEHIA